jgi:hypothetical protein
MYYIGRQGTQQCEQIIVVYLDGQYNTHYYYTQRDGFHKFLQFRAYLDAPNNEV